MTEAAIRRTQLKIKSLLATLKAEKRKFGIYDDSRGRRFLIPALHLSIGEYKECLNYFRWFNKNFPNDYSFPEFYHAWSVALFMNGKKEQARNCLVLVHLLNPYFLGLLRGRVEMHWAEVYRTGADLDYAKAVMAECEEIMTDEYRQWFLEQFEIESFASSIERINMINRELANKPKEKTRKEFYDLLHDMWVVHKAGLGKSAPSVGADKPQAPVRPPKSMTSIPEEVRASVIGEISAYNAAHFSKGKMAYYPEFRGDALYLFRKEYDMLSPIGRLKYTGDPKRWLFAIYKFSIDAYDPEEDAFPGVQYLDGTVTGAMKAGMIAYPEDF